MTDRAPSVTDQLGRAEVLRRLELQILRRLDGRASGDHHTSALGPGSERAGARQYEPGDDARRIDWNLTARSHAVHVRTTEADRELQTWVVADCSASLDFGTADAEKRDLVLGTAASFGILTARAGNRFGVTVAGGDRLVNRPAATGRRALLAALAAVHDSPRQDGAPAPGADLAAALDAVRRLQPRRGVVIVASDYLDQSDWVASLRRVALRHQVVAVHVVDPRELALPDVGLLSVVDPESGRLVHVRTGSAALRARYAAAADQRMQQITKGIRSTGAGYLHVRTDSDWLTQVVAYATSRRRPMVEVMAR